jgi:hypothetical protein
MGYRPSEGDLMRPYCPRASGNSQGSDSVRRGSTLITKSALAKDAAPSKTPSGVLVAWALFRYSLTSLRMRLISGPLGDQVQAARSLLTASEYHRNAV